MMIDQSGRSLSELAGGVAGRTAGVAARLGVGVGVAVLGVGEGVAVGLLGGVVAEPAGLVGRAVGSPVSVWVGRGVDAGSVGEVGDSVGVWSEAVLVARGDGVGAATASIPTAMVSARPARTVPSRARMRITGPSNTTEETPGMGVGLLPV
jgi:hypothetical protein